MKNLSMHKITLISFIVILLSFFIPYLIISSFLKQNEQVDKFYENIKLTVEVINDILVNDFNNAILNYASSDLKPNFIFTSQKNIFKIPKTKYNVFDINVYIYDMDDKNNLYFEITKKNYHRVLRLDINKFLFINFSKLNLDFEYFITNNSNKFIYGNKELYDKYISMECKKNICENKKIYISSFKFFNVNNINILQFYSVFKPSIFIFPINYIKSLLYSIIFSIIITLIYHYFVFNHIMKEYNLNKDLVKNINFNKLIESDKGIEIIQTSIPEFNDLFQSYAEQINNIRIPLKYALEENKKLRKKSEIIENENFAILNFLSSFKKYIYGNINLKTFELSFKKSIDKLSFESKLLKENLNELYNELTIKILELDNIKDNYHNQMNLLSNIIGFMSEKSEYSLNQIELIGELSIYLGKRLNLNDIVLNGLYYGSKLHDIGKIFVPDSILYKTEPLTESDWNLIKLHPKLGLILLSDIKSYPFNIIGKIVISHHEKWNGKGYPYGLSEENIPIESRIVSIIDTLIALISEKPYRAAYSFEEAIDIIKNESGKSFDPKIVDIVLNNIYDIKNIISNKK
jgi:HD-GYP domain-containing protein (c-di-GMP phosphodiesterase class II)